MKETEKVKEIINKNRLLVAVSFAWFIISNLLYFSQVNKFSCVDIRTYEMSSAPGWFILWNQLTLGYVSLYEVVDAPSSSSRMLCSQDGFSGVGYFSFMLLPILTIILLVIAVRWVRKA